MSSPNFHPGFTILELIISMGIMALIMGAGTLSYIIIGKVMSAELAGSGTAWTTHRALSELEEDAREARQMLTASPEVVSFWWRDINEDGVMQTSTEVLTYTWDGAAGGKLTVAGARNRTVASGVQNFHVTYDSGSLAAIRMVTAQLTLKNGVQLATREVGVRTRNLP